MTLINFVVFGFMLYICIVNAESNEFKIPSIEELMKRDEAALANITKSLHEFRQSDNGHLVSALQNQYELYAKLIVFKKATMKWDHAPHFLENTISIEQMFVEDQMDNELEIVEKILSSSHLLPQYSNGTHLLSAIDGLIKESKDILSSHKNSRQYILMASEINILEKTSEMIRVSRLNETELVKVGQALARHEWTLRQLQEAASWHLPCDSNCHPRDYQFPYNTTLEAVQQNKRLPNIEFESSAVEYLQSLLTTIDIMFNTSKIANSFNYLRSNISLGAVHYRLSQMNKLRNNIKSAVDNHKLFPQHYFQVVSKDFVYLNVKFYDETNIVSDVEHASIESTQNETQKELFNRTTIVLQQAKDFVTTHTHYYENDAIEHEIGDLATLEKTITSVNELKHLQLLAQQLDRHKRTLALLYKQIIWWSLFVKGLDVQSIIDIYQNMP